MATSKRKAPPCRSWLGCDAGAHTGARLKRNVGVLSIVSSAELAAMPPRERRTQARAEATRRKLIEAALRAFSERGFDAVTVREIEVAAGVQRNLVSYHFGGKDAMWKAAATHVITKLEAFSQRREEIVRDLSPKERLAYTVRSYVRFCARNPELNRLMIQEGKQDSWRIRWLVDEFLRPAWEQLRPAVKAHHRMDDRQLLHWYYVFVSGAVVFSMGPEAALLFGVDVHQEDIVERHVETMASLLLSEFPA